jgi:hypothetical protein
MKRLSKQEFRKEIIGYFEKNSKMTVKEAKAKIRKDLYIDKWGNPENNYIRVGNVRVFYTPNKNFAGGKKNGYGAGWYITNSTHDINLGKRL